MDTITLLGLIKKIRVKIRVVWEEIFHRDFQNFLVIKVNLQRLETVIQVEMAL